MEDPRKQMLVEPLDPPAQAAEELGWRQRVLRPVGPGSLRGSAANLASAAIGAGCLSMPCPDFSLFDSQRHLRECWDKPRWSREQADNHAR